MEHCNQCILQINLAYQKNENPGVVTKSKCLIGEGIQQNKRNAQCRGEVLFHSTLHPSDFEQVFACFICFI